MLHGATTASLRDDVAHSIRSSSRSARARVPAWLRCQRSVIHSAFNHAVLPPIAMTALLLIGLPVLVLFVFERSEVATRDWVGAGLDLDSVLAEDVSSEGFGHTRFGRYLRELRERFPGPVVDGYVVPASRRARVIRASEGRGDGPGGRSHRAVSSGHRERAGRDSISARIDRRRPGSWR